VKIHMLLLPFALAACSPIPEAGSPARSSMNSPDATAGAASTTGSGVLAQYHWQLKDAFDSNGIRIDALFVGADKPVQLDFTADRLIVVNSCNNMSASFSVKKGQLQLGPMMSTSMACPDAARAALDDAWQPRCEPADAR